MFYVWYASKKSLGSNDLRSVVKNSNIIYFSLFVWKSDSRPLVFQSGENRELNEIGSAAPLPVDDVIARNRWWIPFVLNNKYSGSCLMWSLTMLSLGKCNQIYPFYRLGEGWPNEKQLQKSGHNNAKLNTKLGDPPRFCSKSMEPFPSRHYARVFTGWIQVWVQKNWVTGSGSLRYSRKSKKINLRKANYNHTKYNEIIICFNF